MNLIIGTAEALRIAMRVNDLKIADLKRHGISEQTVYRLFKGKNISVKTLQRLLETAGYHISAIQLSKGPQTAPSQVILVD